MTTNETLTELDVSAHALGNSGVIALSKILLVSPLCLIILLYQVNSHLSTLYYDDNMTGMVGLTAIVGALKVQKLTKFC